MKRLQAILFVTFLWLWSPGLAEGPEQWLQLLNREPGRKTPLNQGSVIFKQSRGKEYPGLVSAGFRQSDGGVLLGKLIWKGQTHSPLSGFAAILNEKGFAAADDAKRRELFQALLQESYGLLGTQVYTSSKSTRYYPQAPMGLRGADDSHRFHIWFYRTPTGTGSGKWREVLYYVPSHNGALRARTLTSYSAPARDSANFPRPSAELFE